jgi:hypothetical protein
MVHECVRDLQKCRTFIPVDLSISNLAPFDDIRKPTIFSQVKRYSYTLIRNRLAIIAEAELCT